MKTNLKLLCTLLFLITVAMPVFADFSVSKPQDQILASELSSENKETRDLPQDIYEPDNTVADATGLGVYDDLYHQHHTLHTPSDVDWFWLGGWGEGQKYHIYTTTADYPTSIIFIARVYRRAYDGSYTCIDVEGQSYGSKIDITITTEGNCTYLIELLNDSGGAAGTYMLWSQEVYPDSYEPDNSASQYTTITPNRDIQIENHTLHTYTDNDWYRFYGTAGVSYLFYSTGPVDIDVGVFGDDGTTDITHDYDSGDDYNFRKIFTPNADAYYKLWVKSWWGLEHSFSTPIGNYGFCYSLNPNPDVYEPDNSASQFTVLPLSTYNQTQDHTLHSNTDQDWYRFYGYTDRRYQFYSTSTTDTQIYLYDDYGTLLDWDDNGGDGNNFYLQFSLPEDAFYKLKVVGSSGAIGHYTLNWVYGLYPDSFEPDDSATQYTALTVRGNNQPQIHNIHNADEEDWYRFHGYPGLTYTFYSTGDFDTRIYLYNYDGSTLLDWDDDDGEDVNFSLQFSPTMYRFYIIKVNGYPAEVGSYVFNYIHSVEQDSYEPDDSATECTTIDTSISVQSQEHTLHSITDQDWIRFQLTAGPGYTYSFKTQGTTDTQGFIYQDDGTTLLDWDDNSGFSYNFAINFAPPATGWYKLKVSGTEGAMGVYEIVLSGITASIPLTFPGNCLNFDNNRYVVCTGIPAYSAITIEGWINHSSLTAFTQRYFTMIDETAVLRKNGNNIQFYFKSSSGSITHITYAYPFIVGQWVHVAGTYDGITANLYVNGDLVNTVTTSGGIYTNTGEFRIGNDGESMRGQIDDVRLWSVVRTQQQIANNRFSALTLPQAGLQSYWRFDSFWGTSAIDACDHSNGTLVNMTDPIWVPSTVPTYYSDSFEPDNSTDQFTAITVMESNQSQDHTIQRTGEEDWFRFYGTAGLTYSFYSTGDIDTRIYLYEDDGTTQLDWDDNDGEELNFSLLFTPTTDNYYKLKVNGNPAIVGSYVFNFSYAYPADLTAPANVNLSIAGTALTITWAAVAGAVSYQIEASSDPYTGFAVIGTTSSTSWTGSPTLDCRFYRIKSTDIPVP